VLGELLFNTGWAGVPAMARRSAIGALGWGVVIAVVVWAGRRLLGMRAGFAGTRGNR
jgi:energy-converting hydrogenase Eha subunit B